MQLRYLEEAKLQKATKVKQDNGSYKSTYSLVNNYKVRFEEITDEASVSIYGTTVNKMYRISSPMGLLEKYLKPKINDSSDNIKLYFIEYNSGRYKISAVRNHWIDIEYIESVINLQP